MNITTFNKTRLLKKVLNNYSLELATSIHNYQQKTKNEHPESEYLKNLDVSIDRCVNEIQKLYRLPSIPFRNVYKRYFVIKGTSKLNCSEED